MTQKVLVVDASPTSRQQVRAILSQAGYDMIEAVSGQEGLSLIANCAGLRLVMCDSALMDLPLASFVKQVSEVRGVNPPLPVLVLGREGQGSAWQQAKSAGAKAQVLKPLQATAVVAAVRACAP